MQHWMWEALNAFSMWKDVFSIVPSCYLSKRERNRDNFFFEARVNHKESPCFCTECEINFQRLTWPLFFAFPWRQKRDCSGWFVFVQTDLKEHLPKIYVVTDSNWISRPLGHTWVGCQQPSDWTTAPSIRVSVGRLFFSDITIQLLSSKLMSLSTRINSRAVDIPYSSKDMPMVIFSTRRVLQYLYELEYCTVAVVYNCTYMVWKSFLFQLYIRMEFVRLGLHFHNQYGVFK